MNNNHLAIAIVFSAFALFGAAFLTRPTTTQAPAFGAAEGPIYSMQRSAVVSVGTASTIVSATSSARRYLLIQNDGQAKAYCNFDGRAAVDQTGFVIAASSSYETYGERLYAGSIACIASSTVKMLVSEAS